MHADSASDSGHTWADRTVLVTGGMGFIGSTLVRRLDALGARVRVADAALPGGGAHPFNLHGVSPRIETVRVDLREPGAAAELVRDRATVFALAAQTSHAESMADPLGDLAVNVRGQLELLEACRRHAPEARIVFASTRQIYGVPRTLPVDETHAVDPVDVNGVHKAAAEAHLRVYHRAHGLRTCALRLTNTYGPRMRVRDARQMFLGAWIRCVLRDEPFEVWGGAQLRDLAYVDDVVDAFVRAADPALGDGRAYNVGGAPPVSLHELARTLVEVAGRGTFRVVEYPASRRPIDIGDYHADDRAFREASGWHPRVGLRDGLARTLDYYRAHLDLYA